jgi:hypothetical protein
LWAQNRPFGRRGQRIIARRDRNRRPRQQSDCAEALDGAALPGSAHPPLLSCLSRMTTPPLTVVQVGRATGQSATEFSANIGGNIETSVNWKAI